MIIRTDGNGIQQFGAELLSAGFDAGHARRLLDEAAEQADHPAGAAEKVLGHSPAGSSPALKSLSWDSIPDRWLVQAAMPPGMS
jgi:type II secretory pathway component PulK